MAFRYTMKFSLNRSLPPHPLSFWWYMCTPGKRVGSGKWWILLLSNKIHFPWTGKTENTYHEEPIQFCSCNSSKKAMIYTDNTFFREKCTRWLQQREEMLRDSRSKSIQEEGSWNSKRWPRWCSLLSVAVQEATTQVSRVTARHSKSVSSTGTLQSYQPESLNTSHSCLLVTLDPQAHFL